MVNLLEKIFIAVCNFGIENYFPVSSLVFLFYLFAETVIKFEMRRNKDCLLGSISVPICDHFYSTQFQR